MKELWQLIKMLFSSKPGDFDTPELLAMKHYPFKGYFPEYLRMDDMSERYQYDDLDEYQPRISERRGRSAYTGRYVRR